ncbi:MAG TPA: hypothetical protein VFM18_16295 [Methanosarcina sp.]|nr:hypothetical protein [Methanosarcina sp.]
MALIFQDPNTAGPFATFGVKDVIVKVVKLTYADFTTGGTASIKAALPADASIIELSYWKKTAFSGNGITAATLSIGTPSNATYFANAIDVHTPAAGNSGHLNPVTNIMQAYNIPLTGDIQLQFTGTSTTGNPTAGEIYIKIVYVR